MANKVINLTGNITNHQFKLMKKLFFILAPFFVGLVAIILGQDINWDLRNYHYYIPYSLLNDRMGFDIVPAHTPNFYNPLLYVPFYYMATYLKPILVSFILGTIQGVNILITYFIAKRLILERDDKKAFFIAAGLSIAGILGGGHFGEIGTMFSDNILSLFVLSSFLITLEINKRIYESPKFYDFFTFCAGILAGISAGFKQTSVIFCMGLCLSHYALKRNDQKWNFWLGTWKAFIFGIGVIGGIIISGGYWLYEMWTRFGNPFFPYFNHIFKSQMGSIAHYRDIRFIPENIWEWLFLPFIWTFNPMEVGEIPFRDIRFAVLYTLLIIAAILLPVRFFSKKIRTYPLVDAGKQWLWLGFFIFGAVTYFFWLKMFGIYRYLVLFEMIAPIAIWLILDYFSSRLNPMHIKYGRIAGIILILLILITIKPANWGRTKWTDEYFGVVTPYIEKPKETMILMAGSEPDSYIIPFFPKEIPFIRLQGFFTGPKNNPNGFDLMMKSKINKHKGDLYVIFFYLEKELTLDVLNAYNLKIDKSSCEKFRPKIDFYIDERDNKNQRHFNFCKVYKK
jgi:hypothetical protein